jgi:hypothetical protein
MHETFEIVDPPVFEKYGGPRCGRQVKQVRVQGQLPPFGQLFLKNQLSRRYAIYCVLISFSAKKHPPKSGYQKRAIGCHLLARLDLVG